MAEIYGDKMSGAGTGDHHRARWAPFVIVLVILAVIVAIALNR